MQKTVKKETQIANLARKATERGFKQAFEKYRMLKAKQDALIPKIAMQKRAWRVELENLRKINQLSGQNPFTILEKGE